MKKFIKTIILMMIISFTLIGAEKVDAKTVSVNKSSVTVRAGSTAKVKVKNAKKVKVKISKKIAKVTVKDKTIIIKALKAGKATISVKSPNMKTKKIKLTVKISDEIAEMKERSKIDGYGDKYKDDIEKYPYLDKKTYAKTSEVYRYSLNEQWKAMPDYIRDCLVYNKVKICFVYDLEAGVKGKMYGTDRMELLNYKYKYNQNFSIIHEAAHNYDFYMEYKGIDIKKRLKKLFKKDKYKYGLYGGSSLREFYAESIDQPIISRLKTITDDNIIKMCIDQVEDIYIEERGGKRHPVEKYITITINWPSNVSIDLNDDEYFNGMHVEDYIDYRKELVKEYYQEIYPDSLVRVK